MTVKKNYLAIEIGGTKLQIVTGDESGKVKEKLRFDIDKNHGAAGIKKQIEDALKDLLLKIKPSAAGIGFGGPVDWKTGKICLSHQIGGWAGFDLANWLQSITNVPVYIDNDANVAALGEAKQGAGKAYNIVFYVTLGSGVGGGLVKNGRIYHGAIPGESEIGHIRLDRNRSTVESKCSGWAVDKKVREAIAKEPNGILGELAKDVVAGEAKLIKSAIEQGDLRAKQILKETGEDLAFGLSHVVHLFHPEVIVLGGGLSFIGEPLRAVVEVELCSYLMEAFLPGPKVFLSKLREDAVPVGALELARQKH